MCFIRKKRNNFDKDGQNMFIKLFSKKKSGLSGTEKYKKILNVIVSGKKLAVASPSSEKEAVLIARELIKKNIFLMEIAYRNPENPQLIDRCISSVCKEVPEMIVFAATVTSAQIAKRAVKSKAQAIVTPGFNPSTVRYCIRHKIPVFPGVATPGEIERAMEMGLFVLKLFPCQVLGGEKFLKALNGPYPDVKFIVSGGISQENENIFLSQKNVCCVSGSYLCPKE